MVNTYADIAIRPDVAGYPLVNPQTSGSAMSDAADAAHFQHILDRLAAQAQTASSSAASFAPRANFAMTKASGWTHPQAAATSSADAAASQDNSHSLKDFVKNVWDVINPLQHIPVVGAIYRHVTGDTISPGAHFAGDALYGGPIGGALAAADIAFQKTTGRDAGETVIAALTGGHSKTPAGMPVPDTMVAQNLTQITPAAGGSAAPAPQAHAGKSIWPGNDNSSGNSGSNDIVWTSPAPLFPPSGTIGGGPASPSTPAQPVLQANSAASTGAVQTQEAPAGAARTAVPPELIASRMMEGLQKYAAMKQQSSQDLNPQLSGLY